MTHHTYIVTCTYCHNPYSDPRHSSPYPVCSSCAAHINDYLHGNVGTGHFIPIPNTPNVVGNVPATGRSNPLDPRLSPYSSLAGAIPESTHPTSYPGITIPTGYRPVYEPHRSTNHAQPHRDLNPMLASSVSPPPPPTKQCSHCSTTSTPLWRREPQTQRLLCNACGLYLQQHGRLRPQSLIDADLGIEEPHADPDPNYTGPQCSHCKTRTTTVWRRSKESGEQLCNACGVYLRTKGCDRPLTLVKGKIRPRRPSQRDSE